MDLPIANASFEAEVGGVFIRPDGVINVLTTPLCQTGLRCLWKSVTSSVTGGMLDAPATTRSTRYVPRRCTSPHGVRSMKQLQEVLLHLQAATVLMCRSTRRVLLRQGSRRLRCRLNRVSCRRCPTMTFSDVMVVNPDPSADAAINDPDGYVHFQTRTNETPTMAGSIAGSWLFQYHRALA